MAKPNRINITVATRPRRTSKRAPSIARKATTAGHSASEAAARTIVYEERDAASRTASQAQQAKEIELVAFVEEIGDGLKLRDDRASEILYRVEQGWSDRKLARLVEHRFHGQLHDRRTEVAVPP